MKNEPFKKYWRIQRGRKSKDSQYNGQMKEEKTKIEQVNPSLPIKNKTNKKNPPKNHKQIKNKTIW